MPSEEGRKLKFKISTYILKAPELYLGSLIFHAGTTYSFLMVIIMQKEKVIDLSLVKCE